MATRIINGKTVLIDDEDAPILDADGWSVQASNDYVVRRVYIEGKKRGIALHRVIACAPTKYHVDHIDGDPLNNQRANLRLCSHAENMRNRKMHKNNKSGLKGVWRERNRWVGAVRANGVLYRKRGFDTPEAAHEWYCEKAKELHGSFARTG